MINGQHQFAWPESQRVRAIGGLQVLQVGKLRTNLGVRLTQVHPGAIAKGLDPHPDALPTE